jgi:Ca2+-binding RTX toxin-like protein
MATYHFSVLTDGEVVDFNPLVDTLVFSDASISASQLAFALTDDGLGMALSVAGKSITLDGLTPYALNASALSFADGSRVLALTAQSNGSLTGGAGADLLIGSTAAKPMTMVSVTADESAGTGFGANLHGVSGDGRFVLFSSSSDDVVAGDTNGQLDVFLRDTVTGTTTRVSVEADGTQLASNGTVFGARAAAVSDDGRTVVFSNFSDAFGGSPFTFDAFAKNLETGAVTLVSATAAGTGANASALVTGLSGNGRFVTFTSSASNLVTDGNGFEDVFVKDLLTGAVQRVSQSGSTEANGASSGGALSSDGRYIAFNSTASNLNFSDTDTTGDVYLRDMSSGFGLTLVSVDSSEVKGNGTSVLEAVSDNGRFVLFDSTSTNLVAGDTNGVRNLFLRDTRLGTTIAVDTNVGGALGNGSVGPGNGDLSGDGRYAVFVSTASNLVDGAGGQQAYVKDLLTGAIAMVSVSDAGRISEGAFDVRLSADGSQVVFTASGASLDPAVGGSGNQAYVVANPLLGVTLTGGAGNDSYLIRRSTDVVVEAAGGGTDTVRASVSATLATNVENLVLTGTQNLDGTGNSGSNVLTGNAGNNRLDGGAGTDTASYATAAAGVTVALEMPGVAQDTGGAGIDTLVAIESLIGSSFDDVLLGNDAGNVIDGGAGSDLLIGGLGNDVYSIDRSSDQVVEAAGGGTDTVRSTISHVLGTDLENLMLLGTGNTNATGNASNNVLTGNSGSNRLDGAGGIDTASYAAARTGVVVGLDRSGAQSTGAGIDTLVAVENLTGSSYNDTLHGSASTNVLNGGAGIDTLSYARAGAAVTVSLALTTAQATGGGGTDTLAAFENLSGSAFADRLTGSSVNNVIDGGLGNDTLTGGLGNDTYLVNAGTDVIVEAASGGIDTVRATASYTLAAQVENLALDGTASINATGNSLNNTITGNAGNNILNGGSGVDIVSYAAATAAVSVNLATGIATGGGGSDSLSSFEYVFGSAFGDTLVGNSAANRFFGGAGADTVTGGSGGDVFVFNSAGSADRVTDFVSGSDRIYLSQTAFRIGDGDAVIDSSSTIAGPNGVPTTSEVVFFTNDAASLSTQDVAAATNNGASFFVAGSSALFVIDDGTSTGIYRFLSQSSNSTISAGELTLIATLENTTDTVLSDYLFIG